MSPLVVATSVLAGTPLVAAPGAAALVVVVVVVGGSWCTAGAAEGVPPPRPTVAITSPAMPTTRAATPTASSIRRQPRPIRPPIAPMVPATTGRLPWGARMHVMVAERQRIPSGSPFEPTIGFSRAFRVGDRVIVSGTGPVLPGGGCPDGAGAQARRCFEIIVAALAEAGASLGDVVRTRMFVVSADDAAAVGAAHGELLGHVRPAATMVVVAGLLDPAWRVEIEAEA